MPVKSLNSLPIIVWQKKCISPIYCFKMPVKSLNSVQTKNAGEKLACVGKPTQAKVMNPISEYPLIGT
jgi:hypothetical protein